MDHSPATGPSVSSAGLRCRCPRCGEGRLYAGVLRLAPRCTACGLDYDFADAGDGPAVFVIFVLGVLLLGAALFVEFRYDPPVWFGVLLWPPVATLLAIGVLRPMKGLMIALQFANKAGYPADVPPASGASGEGRES